MQTSISRSIPDLVFEALERIKEANQDFEEAHDTYLQQYGRTKITVSDPINLTDSIDPVVLILGRNCAVFYRDSIKVLKGSQGELKLEPNEIYIIGRREPQDSKLIIWGISGGVEIEEYNSRVDTIPSRVHGALVNTDDGKVLYLDLGSSAGSILVGQSPELGGPFVRIYDPGSRESPAIRSSTIFTARKS